MKPSTAIYCAASCLFIEWGQAQSAQEIVNAALNPPPGSERYASYGPSLYLKAALYNETPIAPTNYDRLEASAKKRLRPEAYDYAAGGAGLETTINANRAAFDRWQIVPRMMNPIHPKRNLSTTLFNRTLPAPIVMAPVGVQTLFHPTGERATAKIWGEHGLPFTLSTASSTGFADAAEANGEDNPRWYQLYWPSDDDLLKSYVTTAKQNGYEALVVTVDTWDFGWRTRDLDKGYFPFVLGEGVQIGLEDPVAHGKLGFDPLAGNATAEQKQMAALYHAIVTSPGTSPVWGNLKKLRGIWGDKPILLKGVQSAEDAKLAVEYGLDGVIHGGRQIDGAIGSLDTLPSIVEAVKGKLTIGFDSGIRSGSDIFKAIALGADFVQIGRPILWGLAHEGEKGARHVLKSLLAELEINVGLAGCASLKEVTRDLLIERK